MEITINIPPVTVNLNAPALERAMTLLAEAIGWNTAAKVAPEAVAKHGLQKPENAPEIVQNPAEPVSDPIPGPPVTFEQLQAKAAEQVRSGHRDRVKAVLDQYQVLKISQIPEAQRAEALAALGAD